MLLRNDSFAVTRSWDPKVQGARLIARGRLSSLLERKSFLAGPSRSAEPMVSTWHPPLGEHRRLQLRVVQHQRPEPRREPSEVDDRAHEPVPRFSMASMWSWLFAAVVSR